MNKSLCSLLLVLCVLQTVKSLAQDDCLNKIIKTPAYKEKVYTVLSDISKQCDCYFSYPTQTIPYDKNIELPAYKGSVLKYLNTLFSDSIKISTFKNQIILGDINITDGKRFKYEGQKLIKFSGVILDSLTHKPVPFSSVSVKGSYIGTAANSDGEFSIKIPAICINSELLISSLGYGNGTIPIKNFMNDSVVYLGKSNVNIEEVLIKGVGADVLIGMVKENLKTNYRILPYCYNAFYREYINKFDKCITYSEALFKGCSPNARVIVKDRLVLQNARVFNKTNMESDTLNLKLKGGIDAVMNLDIVNDIPDFLDDNNFYLYNYEILDIQIWNNELVYVIGFKPDVKGNEAMFTGELYVTFDTYTLQGAEFRYNDEMLEKLKDVLVYKKKNNVRAKPYLYNYRVEYKNIGGLYHLHHVRGDLRVDMKQKKQLLYVSYNTIFEMIITDVDTVNIIKPKRKELFETGNIFSEYINYSPDTYWQNTNIIEPEKEIMKAFIKSGFVMTIQE